MEAINKGHLPNVESAWFYVCRNEGLKAIRQATDFLEKEVKSILQAPINAENIEDLKSQIREKVLTRFKKRALGSQESHPDLL